MPLEPPVRWSRLALPLLAIAPLVLSGCGAGRNAQTTTARYDQDYTVGQVGEVALRNIHIPSVGLEALTADKAVLVLGSLVNNGKLADRLVSASSPDASSVTVRAADGPGPVVIPGGGVVRLTSDGPHIELAGTTEALRSGGSVTVTLTFARSGDATLLVPVQVVPERSPGPLTEY